jgi:hypothetical protein
MAYEIREGNGSLFRNDKKEQGSNQRDYNGSCLINGQEMWISAWLKTGQNGTNYMSLSFEPKQQQAPPQQQQNQYQQQPPQNQGYQPPQYPQPGQQFQQPQQQQPAPQQQRPQYGDNQELDQDVPF